MGPTTMSIIMSAKSLLRRLPRTLRRPAFSTAKQPDTPAAESGEFHSVEQILKEHLPADKLEKVQKVLYGLNQGQLVKEVPVPAEALKLAKAGDFDVKLHKFGAAEESRSPRIVRFGVTQNAIIEP